MLGGLAQRYLRDATIVLGDFNRPREEVTDLLADSNIHPAPRPLAPNQQPQHQTWYTRFERRLQCEIFSELDYIASNRYLSPCSSLLHNEPLTSDHLLIMSSIDSSDLQVSTSSIEEKQRIEIKGDIHEREIIDIFLDDRWPQTQFVDIAKSKGLTEVVRRRERSLLDELLILE